MTSSEPASVRSAGVLVDARDYYRALCKTLLAAKRYVLIAGWQFDSKVRLLRGLDAARAAHPVELLPFLEHLCERRPHLSIYLLAWDYSAVFALEREWMQRLIFEWSTPRGIHFHFDAEHAAGASHHEKMVVADGELAFVGGLDLARSRWDDRTHDPANALRVERGVPQKPYHETMAFCTGEAARALTEHFSERWLLATGEPLALPAAPSERRSGPKFPGALPIRCRELAYSRTRAETPRAPQVSQIKKLYERAIAVSERLIYVETQYFTARSLHDALVERMRDRARPPPEIVLLLPRGADTPKENLVIGPAQDEVVSSLLEEAQRTGTRFRAYYTGAPGPDGELVPTFIHSKLVVVDDRFLSIGSANFTNRSLALDTELNLCWECDDSALPLWRSIGALRASLLAEHAGAADPRPFRPLAGLVDRLDALVSSGESKLHHRTVPRNGSLPERLFHLERVFDPDRPLDDLDFETLFERSA